MNLLQKNPKTCEIRVQSSNNQATVYVYDVIDDIWGIDAESFVREINALDVSTLHVRINSPGGDVFTARAMQTALSQHPAAVIVHIDGLAASAATFLAMAATKVNISEGAFFMIHKSWAFTVGNADELRTQASLIDVMDSNIANDYAKRTGIDYQNVMQMMDDETWLSAEQAVSKGFADEVISTVADRHVDNKFFDLSAYRHPPDNYQPDHPAALRAHLERRLALIA